MATRHHLLQIIAAVIMGLVVVLNRKQAPSPNNRSRFFSNYEYVIMSLLVLVGAYLRFSNILSVYGSQLSIDERTLSVNVLSNWLFERATFGSTRLASIFSLLLTYKLLGFEPLYARYISAIAGIVAVIFLFLFGLELLGQKRALWVATVSWISLTFVHFSRIALENIWVFTFTSIFSWSVIKFLNLKHIRYLAVAGISLFFGIFSYAGFSIGVLAFLISIVALIGFYKKQRERLFKVIATNYKPLIFATIILAVAVLVTFKFLTGGLLDLQGGGGYSWSDSVPNMIAMLRDLFVSADTWYLQQPAMAMFELPLIPLAIYGFFILRQENKFFALVLLLSIVICWLLAAPTGIYFGARRILYVLFPFWIFSGVGCAGVFKKASELRPTRKFFAALSLSFCFATIVYYSQTLGREAEVNRYFSAFWHPPLNESFLRLLVGREDVFLSAQNVGAFPSNPERKYYDAYFLNHQFFNLEKIYHKEFNVLYSYNQQITTTLPKSFILIANAPFEAWDLIAGGFCLTKNGSFLNTSKPFIPLYFYKGRTQLDDVCYDNLSTNIKTISVANFCSECFESMWNQRVQCLKGNCANTWSDALYIQKGLLAFSLLAPAVASKREFTLVLEFRSYFEGDYSPVKLKIGKSEIAQFKLGWLDRAQNIKVRVNLRASEFDKPFRVFLDTTGVKDGLAIIRAGLE